MNHPPSATSPVSFVAHVARLPKKGMPVIIEADDKQRGQLAVDHGLEAVKRYQADLLVVPWKSSGVRVTGTVQGDIVQTCVVTLEPIDVHINEEVLALFVPEDSRLARIDHHSSSEIVLEADGPDGPELFSGDSIDVGALAEQFFALAIDPYPRKPGVSLQASTPASEDPDDAVRLFSKLKVLRPEE